MLGGVEEQVCIETVRVSLTSEAGELVLMDNGKPFPCVRERIREITRAGALNILVHLGQGNYSAEARGAL